MKKTTLTAPATPRPPLKQIYLVSPPMGCDPEFFFRIDKKIVGAESLLPKDGLKKFGHKTPPLGYKMGQTNSKFVIDGVQAELNPQQYACRANLANEISDCFRLLDLSLKNQGKNVQIDFSRSVTITKKELNKCDPANQRFGCMPSLNAYGDATANLGGVDPLKYLRRSAGGHIHIELDLGGKDPNKLVHLLDMIVGNTCVLVDREKGNVARRKLYGRAGEYRLPKHGLEYRVLSNFWLHAYPLMSLAFGLARMAVSIFRATGFEDIYKVFTEVVDMKDIQKAINTNNYKLAYKNYKKIEPLIMQLMPNSGVSLPLSMEVLKEFEYFFTKINEEGLKYWFKTDPLQHWINLPEGHSTGAHDFLRREVRDDMARVAAKAVKTVEVKNATTI